MCTNLRFNRKRLLKKIISDSLAYLFDLEIDLEPTRVACVGLKGIHNTGMDLELELQMDIETREPCVGKKGTHNKRINLEMDIDLEMELEPSRVGCVW